MPPKKLNKKADKKGQDDSNKPAVSEEEVRQESGKAANAALAAQKKAKELKDAAAAASDPDERQRLTEEATNAHIEAESFGKTAKYLRSGAFQGMAMGTGLGVAPGATLGAITGTLVGGISSTLLGGIGAGIGGATGALHGPWVNMGKVAGKGMKKLTSFLPQWAASEEQKKTLEKMMGQANEEEMPGTEELEKFKSEGGGGEIDEGWMASAKGMMPDQKEVSDAAKAGAQATDGDSDSKPSTTQSEEQPSGDTAQKSDTQGRKKPRKLNAKQDDSEPQPAKMDDITNDADGLSNPSEAPGIQNGENLDERKKELDRRESELNRRQAELDEREKALTQHEHEQEQEQEQGSKPDDDVSESTTAQKPKGQPRKLASRS